MELHNLKENMFQNIDDLFKKYYEKEIEYQNVINNKDDEIKDIRNKITELTNFNNKLVNEISEKDKLLITKDKIIIDYEEQIKKLTTIKEEEENNANKVSMLKTKDKALHEKENENKILKSKIAFLENKGKDNVDNVEKDKDINIVENIEDVKVYQNHTWP